MDRLGPVCGTVPVDYHYLFEILLPEVAVVEYADVNDNFWGADDADVNATDDGSDDESSSSSSDAEEVQDKDNANVHDLDLDLNLKIGYKHKKEPLHLNYGNMSVPALRQLAKERGLGGEDADLQKLKKKNLVQLLQ